MLRKYSSVRVLTQSYLALASSNTFPGLLAGRLLLGMLGVACRGVRGVGGADYIHGGKKCIKNNYTHQKIRSFAALMIFYNNVILLFFI